jgi:hypothetical protein
MPEIAEGASTLPANTPKLASFLSLTKYILVARVVHFLRAHLVGRTIKNAMVVEDTNVFGKAGTTGMDFVNALSGRKVSPFANMNIPGLVRWKPRKVLLVSPSVIVSRVHAHIYILGLS